MSSPSALALLLCASLAWTAPARSLELDLAALYAQPVGTLSGDEDVRASDLLSRGLGLIGDLLFPVKGALRAGAQLGVYQVGQSDEVERFVGEFRLTQVPLHALAQYRFQAGSQLGFWLQGGVGLTLSTLRAADFVEPDADLSPSLTIGGGVAYSISRSWQLTGGLQYHYLRPGGECTEQALWCQDERPQFLFFTFGARRAAQPL